MPVIKRGSRAIGAGQAAAAFDRATAGQRDTTIAVSRLKQQQQQYQQDQARRADYDSQRRQAQERSFQIQERRLDSQNASAVRNQLGRTSQYGGNVNGQSIVRMATRVSELDRAAYEELDQQFDALTGGVFNDSNPLTPEALDAHPKREAIYTLVGGYLAPLEKAADRQAVQTGKEELVQNVSLMGGKDWIASADGVKWDAKFKEDFANAQQSGAGLTSQQARALYKEHQAKATAAIDLYKRRNHFQGLWDAKRDDPSFNSLDEGDRQRAANEMAGIGSSTEPRTKYIKAMTFIDADFKLAAQLAYQDGQQQGVMGAATAQVRKQQAMARENFDSEFASQQAQPASGGVQGTMDAMRADLNKPPAQINVDAAPAARALGLDDTARREIREELKASDVDPDDEEGVRRFIQGKLRRDKMRQGIYRDEYTQKRYTGTPQ